MAKNILVTNDDGCDSPGLWTLARALQPAAAKLYVIAPRENQSAVGAGMTLRRELHWERIEDPPVEGVEAWWVNGTPADCVLVGLRRIVRDWIDVVASGVNLGANVGNDILASGTVGGALQGHFRGLTALAVSQVTESLEPRELEWEVSGRVCSLLATALRDEAIPENVFLNVNIPNAPFEGLRGLVMTRVGRHGYMRIEDKDTNSAVLERETSPHMDPESPPGTDFWALAHGYVSVSPLQANLTDHRLIDVLGERLEAVFRA